jgi:hypothetical protein
MLVSPSGLQYDFITQTTVKRIFITEKPSTITWCSMITPLLPLKFRRCQSWWQGLIWDLVFRIDWHQSAQWQPKISNVMTKEFNCQYTELFLCLLLCGRLVYFRPWRWNQFAPPKSGKLLPCYWVSHCRRWYFYLPCIPTSTGVRS